MDARLVDLSHTIHDGMVTYPGLPAPRVGIHMSRDTAESIYGPGVTFEIGLVEICTNTGTYLDVPYHRFADGYDLASLPLDRVAEVPAICLDKRNTVAVELTDDDLADLGGHAVLIRTDHSDHFGTPRYATDHPHLTTAAATALVSAGVACVGIDSINIDSTDDLSRPVHTALLGSEIPILEHLTNLAALPPSGFRLTAVPPKIERAGTFTVRAYATLQT